MLVHVDVAFAGLFPLRLGEHCQWLRAAALPAEPPADGSVAGLPHPA
jgi:hypothetical protein